MLSYLYLLTIPEISFSPKILLMLDIFKIYSALGIKSSSILIINSFLFTSKVNKVSDESYLHKRTIVLEFIEFLSISKLVLAIIVFSSNFGINETILNS